MYMYRENRCFILTSMQFRSD